MTVTEKILSDRDALQYSPLALAFLGDAVYEQKIRARLLENANMPVNKLHKLAVARVCAEYQAHTVHMWLDENVLDELELSVLKRGRNANGINVPSHATVSEYRLATAMECLFGFLRLTGRDKRIDELFNSAWDYGGQSDEH